MEFFLILCITDWPLLNIVSSATCQFTDVRKALPVKINSSNIQVNDR